MFFTASVLEAEEAEELLLARVLFVILGWLRVWKPISETAKLSSSMAKSVVGESLVVVSIVGVWRKEVKVFVIGSTDHKTVV
jgi:hypothetical protein